MKKKIPDALTRFSVRMLAGSVLAGCLLTCTVIPGSAETTGSVYTFIPQSPENQTGESGDYFDLVMEGAGEQVIEVEFQNHSNMDVTVNTEISNMDTARYGIAENGDSDIQTEESTKYKLSDFISIEEETEVSAGESHVFQFTIKIPQEGFDGLLSGGIVFHVKPEPEDTQPRELGTSVTEDSELNSIAGTGALKGTRAEQIQTSNETSKERVDEDITAEYVKVVPVLLRVEEEAAVPQLSLTDVTLSRENNQHVIKVNVQNETALYISETLINAYIYKKGESEILYESHKEGVQIAPNSSFEYAVTSMEENAEAGDYTLNLEIRSGECRWSWNADFTINQATDENVSNLGLFLDAISKNFMTYIILAASGAVLILFVLIRWRKKEQREEELIKAMKDLMKSI